ncbi:MAG: sulfur carrier protein ThiS [Bacteroidales bacterium]
MKILLNNRKEEFACETITVEGLLIEKKYSFRLRIIKINGILISKENYGITFIHEGDNVQMLYLMSGG